jgi:hypothetical protein
MKNYIKKSIFIVLSISNAIRQNTGVLYLVIMLLNVTFFNARSHWEP